MTAGTEEGVFVLRENTPGLKAMGVGLILVSIFLLAGVLLDLELEGVAWGLGGAGRGGLFVLGVALAPLGAWMAFGQSRTFLDTRNRRWWTVSGIFRRVKTEGDFSDLEALAVYERSRPHGATWHVFHELRLEMKDGESLHLGHKEEAAVARALAKEISNLLGGLPVREER